MFKLFFLLFVLALSAALPAPPAGIVSSGVMSVAQPHFIATNPQPELFQTAESGYPIRGNSGWKNGLAGAFGLGNGFGSGWRNKGFGGFGGGGSGWRRGGNYNRWG